jgi:hypothetical protein
LNRATQQSREPVRLAALMGLRGAGRTRSQVCRTLGVFKMER